MKAKTKINKPLTYAQAGVSRDVGDELVKRIGRLAARTVTATAGKRLKQSVGGYASLYEITSDRWIAATTDGVGTKLKLAFETNTHTSVGQDLVAMCVNDLLCVGARPLFFLDYFATGKLKLGVAQKVLQGIAEGCRQGQMALVGGETAEMPGLYREGEYDLAGFAVGELSPRQVLPRKKVPVGAVLLGLESSGFHSNGYSLLRKLLERASPRERAVLRQKLLVPTRIYTSALLPLLKENEKKNWIFGLSHITGSGFLNVPRMSDQVSYQIRLPLPSSSPIFSFMKSVQALSGLDLKEWASTFNCGVGMVLAVDSLQVEAIERQLRALGENPIRLGETVKKQGKECTVTVLEMGAGVQNKAVLTY